MRRGIAVALAVVALSCGARAAAYDDYFRGIEAMSAGKFDLAISSFTSALNAGDLAAAYVPDAHMRRAQAYLQKQQCASAVADLDAALKLKPNDANALGLRSAADRCLGKPDAARADLDAAIAAAPAVPGLYRARGDLAWYGADFAQAATDYAEAAKLAPKYGYFLLWYAISAKRAGTFDAAGFARQVSDYDGDDWTQALLDFMRGKQTSAAVYKSAAEPGGDAAKGRKCEADFYIGEWQLPADTSKTLLQQARDECPHNFVEYGAALEDLKRIP